MKATMEPPPFPVRADLGFAWSVKDSFLSYVSGMRDGDIAWDAGASVTNDGEFYFPLRAAHRATDALMLLFCGSVRFTAHHGLLSVSITNPRITIRDGAADLLLRVGNSDERIAILKLPPRIEDGDVTMWLRSGVALADFGSELFGGSYAAGEPFAPLTLRVPTRVLGDSFDRPISV